MIFFKKIITISVVLILLCFRVYGAKLADMHVCSDHGLATIEKHNVPLCDYAIADDDDVDLSKRNQTGFFKTNHTADLSTILGASTNNSTLLAQKKFYSTPLKLSQTEAPFLMNFRI